MLSKKDGKSFGAKIIKYKIERNSRYSQPHPPQLYAPRHPFAQRSQRLCNFVPVGIDGFPMKSGKIRNLEDFDSQFFKIRGRDADLMDPQSRKLLEVSFEAIVDAGE